MISSLCSPLFQCFKTEPSSPHQSPTYFVFGFLKRHGLSAYTPLNILDLASSTIDNVWPLHRVSGFDIQINAGYTNGGIHGEASYKRNCREQIKRGCSSSKSGSKWSSLGNTGMQIFTAKANE